MTLPCTDLKDPGQRLQWPVTGMIDDAARPWRSLGGRFRPGRACPLPIGPAADLARPVPAFRDRFGGAASPLTGKA